MSWGRHFRGKASQSGAASFPFSRGLRFEPLEERRLLANVAVSNLNDVVNGTTTSITALIAAPGADGISLREAIQAANADSTVDTIDFSVTGTIQLTNVGHAGEISINNDLTINGPGASLLTIRGLDPSATLGDGARIVNIQVPVFTRSSLPMAPVSSPILVTNARTAVAMAGGSLRMAAATIAN